MRTEELINRLALARPPAPGSSLGLAALVALSVGLSAAIVLFGFGIRSDFLSSLDDPRVIFKFTLSLVTAAAAAVAAMRLSRPGVRLGGALWALVALPLLVAAGVAAELVTTDAGDWATAAMGSNSIRCLTMVPLLAAAPLVASFVVLRRGAPTRPAVAGALAGLAAAGLGAALYAAYCADDSPLFVAIWYTLAIGLVAGAGALFGNRLLRW